MRDLMAMSYQKRLSIKRQKLFKKESKEILEQENYKPKMKNLQEEINNSFELAEKEISNLKVKSIPFEKQKRDKEIKEDKQTQKVWGHP